MVVHNQQLTQNGAKKVYTRIKEMVNGFSAHYRFPETPHHLLSAGDGGQHSRAISDYLGGQDASNIFILDFLKPRGKLDPEYGVIKMILAQSGYLSQMVNFRTHQHDTTTDQVSNLSQGNPTNANVF